MQKSILSKYINIIILLLVLAILSILFSDFAGWYHGNYYLKMYEEWYIYMWSGILTTIILTVVVVILWKSIKLLLEINENNKKNNKRAIKNINKVILYVKYVLWIIVASALIFIINVEWNDTEERWLDDGFYIPITLWIIVIIICKKILKNINTKKDLLNT